MGLGPTRVLCHVRRLVRGRVCGVVLGMRRGRVFGRGVVLGVGVLV